MSLNIYDEIKREKQIKGLLHDDSQDQEYIAQYRNGTLNPSRSWEIPGLDKHWKLTPKSLDMFLGTDGAGKSTWIWFLMVIASHRHDYKWLILTYENLIPRVKIMMMQFYLHQWIKDPLLSDKDVQKADEFVKTFFRFVRIDKPLSAFQVLELGERFTDINGLVIDPYSSLLVDRTRNIGNKHDYDSEVLNYMKLFTRDICSIWLTLHPFSEGARKLYPKDHDLAGYLMPLEKADGEGGQKFANRADSFSVIHRLYNHPDYYNITEIHVKKVKDYEITGMPTQKEEPVKMKYEPKGIGFKDESGRNPLSNEPIEKPYNHLPF